MVQFGVNSLLGWQEYVAGDVFRTMFDVINGMVVLRSGMAFCAKGPRSSMAHDLEHFGPLGALSIR